MQCDDGWLRTGTAAHTYTDRAAGPVIPLSPFLPVSHSSKLNLRKRKVQEVGSGFGIFLVF